MLRATGCSLASFIIGIPLYNGLSVEPIPRDLDNVDAMTAANAEASRHKQAALRGKGHGADDFDILCR